METERIAIIGAGMAGLACARRLTEAGRAPVVLDKGRGIGGRLATRRTPEGWQFDHGAQDITATAGADGSDCPQTLGSHAVVHEPP